MADLNIGNSSANVVVNTKHNGSVTPQIDNTYDLGTSDLRWKNIYGNLKGNADTATTATNLASAGTWTWTNGTTAGPTASLVLGGKTTSIEAIPSASSSASGVITTGTQTIAGEKTFTSNLSIKRNTPNLYITDTNTGIDTYSIIRFGSTNASGTTNANAAYIFLNGPQRTGDGGTNLMTIRNNVGDLRLNNDVINTGKLTVGQATKNASYNFYVNGTSYFNGDIYLPCDKTIYQNQKDTSNYTTIATWLKGSTSQKDANGNAYTYQPEIGQHNTGGTDSLGSITILPYATNTEPWNQAVGLYITKNVLKLDGNRIPTAGLNGSVGSATVPVYSDGGVLKTITSYSGNAATSTISRSLGSDDTMKVYGQYNNEVNFGGTNDSSTIYFGYRAVDSKPIPSKFLFGGTTGTAELVAAKFTGTLNGHANSSTYLYADNNPYRYGDSNPYYAHMTYNVYRDNRWYLRVYPETPKEISVDYAYNADKIDGYHLIAGGVSYQYINTINQPTANTAWYLRISTLDWNNDNEIIAVHSFGDNRSGKTIIYSGSRQDNWHAYATQYNGTCCTGIKKNISSCDNVYIRLDSATTSVTIYTTFYPRITTTTDADGYTMIPTQGGLFGNSTTFDRVHGAVWNDYAEYRETHHEIEPGRCVIEIGDGSLTLSFDRLQPGANIVSDTFGFAIGETEINKTPLAVSGRVLAYPNEPRESYHAGDPVCSGPNGTISRMTREEVREWPDRIVGTVSEIPSYETWGTGNVKVDGRIWIKVK